MSTVKALFYGPVQCHGARNEDMRHIQHNMVPDMLKGKHNCGSPINEWIEFFFSRSHSFQNRNVSRGKKNTATHRECHLTRNKREHTEMRQWAINVTANNYQIR